MSSPVCTLWTADTQTAQERADWTQETGRDGSASAGHRRSWPHAARARSRTLRSSPTRQSYLTRFEQELAKAPNSAALIEAMKSAYPAAGLMVALEIGAKVNKGEMKW